MISDLNYSNGKLTWTTSTGEIIEKEYAGATYIFDSNAVVVLYDESSIAVALNKKGNEICRITNSEDMYLRFDEKTFVKASDAR